MGPDSPWCSVYIIRILELVDILRQVCGRIFLGARFRLVTSPQTWVSALHIGISVICAEVFQVRELQVYLREALLSRINPIL